MAGGPAAADQTEPLVVRAVNLRLLVELSGLVRNPQEAVGDGNVAALNARLETEAELGQWLALTRAASE